MIALNNLAMDGADDFKGFDVLELLEKCASRACEATSTFVRWQESVGNFESEREEESAWEQGREAFAEQLCYIVEYVLSCAVKCNIDIEEELPKCQALRKKRGDR